MTSLAASSFQRGRADSPIRRAEFLVESQQFDRNRLRFVVPVSEQRVAFVGDLSECLISRGTREFPLPLEIADLGRQLIDRILGLLCRFHDLELNILKLGLPTRQRRDLALKFF